MACRIGVDIDGTFTDVAPVDEDRKIQLQRPGGANYRIAD